MEALPKEFQLSDLDRFIPSLHRRHPANNHLKEKIRQQLQVLRDEGALEFRGSGWYAQTAQAPSWNLKPGQETTRKDLANLLDMDGPAAIGRGMFKRASGPFSKDLILIHDAVKNPYGDKIDSNDRITYIGQGQKGDQKMEGFNKTLARHLEEGVNVHFFVKQGTEASLRYEGQVVLEELRREYREAEGRSVLEFVLRPSVSNDAGLFGGAYQEILEESLEPHVVDRPTKTNVVERVIRDRAFASHVCRQYDDQCVVCGPPLVHENNTDVQGAHVRAVSAGGPDAINNGLSLCSRHHWAFDHGIFSLSPKRTIQLRTGFHDPHRELRHGESILEPRNPEAEPHDAYLHWHRRTWKFD